jgi:glycosyltransferase involved in cell wall biosynthesis
MDSSFTINAGGTSLSDEVNPLVYVVVRNRNQAADLRRLVRALELQTRRSGLVLVDNDSTDDSIDVARAYGARIVNISREDFSFGRAINVGVEAAPAEFIVLLSSHSLPLSSTFIEDCLRPFSDPDVAATKCLRLDNSERWMDLRTISGPIGWDIPLWDLPENNGCVFRKSVWRKFPFDESVEAAEDKLWSYQLLNGGFKIAESSALYKYCHEDRFWASLRRFTRVQVSLYRMRGMGMNPYPPRLVFREFFRTIPRQALKSAAYLALRCLVFQTVPWRARRKSKLGSVR